MRYIAGHILITEQLLQQAIEDEEELRRLEQRLASDPEFAAEWRRQQDAREDED